MVRAIARILVLCLTVAALFAFSASTTFAATTANSKPATIHPNVSFQIGICVGEVLGYQITSRELGGAAAIQCTSPVRSVDFVNKVYYCTNGIPSLDICFNWQLKAYKSHCLIAYTSSTSCPPNSQDTYNVGTNQLWRFESSICITFADGTSQCATGHADVAF